MKKIIAILITSFFFSNAFSQYIYYASAEAGLSMREQPNTTSKVLEKIDYGEKLVSVADSNQLISISTEGFTGYWWKVKYNNKTGYVVNSYVLPMPPPKSGVKTVQDYFTQVSAKSGALLVIKKSDEALNEMGESQLTKQLYKNGMEWHNSQGYEHGSDIYFLPDFTIEQAFLLIRLVGQYPDLISDKDPFPTKKSTVKNDIGNKTIEVERENYDGKPGPVKKIKIFSEQGAITDFEIYIMDSQAVIFWSSGV